MIALKFLVGLIFILFCCLIVYIAFPSDELNEKIKNKLLKHKTYRIWKSSKLRKILKQIMFILDVIFLILVVILFTYYIGDMVV